jgi:hypothetical protein
MLPPKNALKGLVEYNKAVFAFYRELSYVSCFQAAGLLLLRVNRTIQGVHSKKYLNLLAPEFYI